MEQPPTHPYHQKLERLNEILQILKKDKEEAPYAYFIPFPYQEEFLKSNAFIRIILGGNFSGKTTIALYDVITSALGVNKYKNLTPPLNIRIIGNDFQKAIAEVIQPTMRKFLPNHLIKHFKKNQQGVIVKMVLTNGTTIDFGSYEQPEFIFEGWAGNIAYFDEPPPRNIFIPCIRGLIRSGYCIVAFTPFEDKLRKETYDRLLWLYQDLYMQSYQNGGDNKDIEVFNFWTIQNKSISPEALKKFESLLSDDEKQARLYGKWQFLAGTIFSEFKVSEYVIDEYEISSEKSNIFIGIDPHSVSPTGVLFTAIDKDNNVVIFDELYEEKMVLDELVRKIKDRIGNLKISRIYIDPSANERNPINSLSWTDEFVRRLKMAVIPAKRDPRDIGITRIKTLLKEKKLFVFKKCKNFIDELTRFRNLPQDADHLLDCLRYILSGNIYVMDKADEREILAKSFDPLYNILKGR